MAAILENSKGAFRPVPMAQGWPLLGASVPLLRNPLAYLRRAYATHGPVFEVRAARRQFTVLAGTEANRFVAVEGRDMLRAQPFWGRLADQHECPHLLLATDGADHKRLRSIYHDDLSKHVVAEFADEVATLVVSELARVAGATGVFGVRDFARGLVSRQAHCLLTRGAAPIDPHTTHALMELFRFDTNVLLLGKWPRLVLRSRRYRRYTRHAYEFLDHLVRDTERSMPPGWFSTTHRARQQHPDLFTSGDVRFAFLLPFVAGVDTVGATLSFLIYELLRNRSLRRRVTTAVDTCYDSAGARSPSLAELRAVPELRGLVLETLRLYPAAFAIYRRAASAFELAGYRVPAGRDLVVFTTSTHTDPRYFPHPYRFDIDRFAPPHEQHKQRYVFAPYGGGPHICLGAGMGEALLMLTAATLVRRVELTPTQPRRAYAPVFDPSLAMPRQYSVRVTGWR